MLFCKSKQIAILSVDDPAALSLALFFASLATSAFLR